MDENSARTAIHRRDRRRLLTIVSTQKSGKATDLVHKTTTPVQSQGLRNCFETNQHVRITHGIPERDVTTATAGYQIVKTNAYWIKNHRGAYATRYHPALSLLLAVIFDCSLTQSPSIAISLALKATTSPGSKLWYPLSKQLSPSHHAREDNLELRRPLKMRKNRLCDARECLPALWPTCTWPMTWFCNPHDQTSRISIRIQGRSDISCVRPSFEPSSSYGLGTSPSGFMGPQA